jgi:NhaA family Na+:H+ antiporter
MVMKYFRQALIKFMQYQASSGILLLVMALFAILFANSQLKYFYHHLLEMPVVFQVGFFGIDMHFDHFVNDALMAVFFLLVTLEVKREVAEGQLSTRDQQILPVLGAIGGVAIPALIYLGVNNGLDSTRGWAIPTATDIAFALGVMSLLGKRVPTSLKAFLTALAIIDDLVAILIIAFFYNNELNLQNLLAAGIVTVVLVMLNNKGVGRKSPYIIAGILLWFFVLGSGIHATIAGVVLGLTIPLEPFKGRSLLKSMEHSLEPWAAFIILPLFAFCNAGVSLEGFSFSSILTNPISLGITAGLFLGKQLGVFLLIFAAVKLKLASSPQSANWGQIYGVAMLTGIGFTMSIFIGNLAFTDPEVTNNVRIGILAGSVLSAVAGFLILYFTCPKKEHA